MEITFETDMFNLIEDQHLHTGVFGKNVARWLAVKLSEKGYSPEIKHKEWGWEVKIRRGEIGLFVGIKNDWKDVSSLEENMIVWRVFTGYNLSLKEKILSALKNLDPDSYLYMLDSDIKNILYSESRIKILEIKES
ncbi:hypothetical protein [Persephonella sp.]